MSDNDMPNPKLLIVEDNNDRIETLTRFLEPNYSLSFAKNSEDGVKEIADHPFDVAIIDWRLPFDKSSVPEPGGGVRVMQEINERHPSVPVIITYSWDTPEEIRKHVSVLKSLNIAGILEKPLLLDELADSIRNALPKAGVAG